MAPADRKFRFVLVKQSELEEKSGVRVTRPAAEASFSQLPIERRRRRRDDSNSAAPTGRVVPFRAQDWFSHVFPSQDGVPDFIARAGVGSPIGPLSANRSDPFDSFSQPLIGVESLLLNNFIDFIAGSNTPEQAEWVKRATRHWVQTAASDRGMIATILTASAMYAYAGTGSDRWNTYSLKYQAEVLASLRQGLLDDGKQPSQRSIILIVNLLSEAIARNDPVAAQKHAIAAIQIFRSQMQYVASQQYASPQSPAATTPEPRETESDYRMKGLVSLYMMKSVAPATQMAPFVSTNVTAESCHEFRQHLLLELASGRLTDLTGVQLASLNHRCRICSEEVASEVSASERSENSPSE